MKIMRSICDLLNELLNIPLFFARVTAAMAFLDVAWKIVNGEILTLTSATNLAPIAQECLLFGFKGAIVYVVIHKFIGMSRQSLLCASLPVISMSDKSAGASSKSKG